MHSSGQLSGEVPGLDEFRRAGATFRVLFELANQRMKVKLGKFVVEELAAFGSGDLVADTETALRFYAREVAREVQFPRPDSSWSRLAPAEGATEIELTLDPEVSLVLEGEARRWRLEVEEIALHATLIFLAACDREQSLVSETVPI
jgi:hypothetical protein